MPRLRLCPSCAQHVLFAERSCPHCGATRIGATSRRVSSAAAAALLGLSVAACDKNRTQSEPPMYGDDSGADEPSQGSEPDYGVPATDDDVLDATEPEYGVPAIEEGSGASSDDPIEEESMTEAIYGIAEPPE